MSKLKFVESLEEDSDDNVLDGEHDEYQTGVEEVVEEKKYDVVTLENTVELHSHDLKRSRGDTGFTSNWLARFLQGRRESKVMPPPELTPSSETYLHEFNQSFISCSGASREGSESDNDDDFKKVDDFPEGLKIENLLNDDCSQDIKFRLYNLPYQLTEAEVCVSVMWPNVQDK